MKKILIIVLFVTGLLNAQKQEISLDDIWGGQFRMEYMNSLNSMNGNYYSLNNYDRETKTTSIDKYSYKTLKKTSTIVSTDKLEGIDYIDTYAFNSDESKLLISVDRNKIYRHSFSAHYYVYDLASKKLSVVDADVIQEPLFSPDSKKVAYVKQNNIYVLDLSSSKTTQVTKDGEFNNIINGITDWVYEEEFAFVRAFDWSTDSEKLAFLRTDESEVPEFSMDITGTNLYPTQQVFKYPKAGEKNAELSLHIYDLASAESKKVTSLDDYEYIARLNWTKDANTVSVITLNRHQNDLKLNFVNATTLANKVVLNEVNNTYIDITDNLTYLSDNSFIWTSEKDGYNHIYHYSKEGQLKKQLTKGEWEVTQYYGYNSKTKTIFYQSGEDGSINRTIYSVKLNGKSKKRIANASGTNAADFSKNFNYFIHTYSDSKTPYIYTLYSGKNGKKIKEIKNNDKLLAKLEGYQLANKEFSTIKTKDGEFNSWIIKPLDFDANKTYPLLMFQYSGPGSQQVANRWNGSNDYWYSMLASKGYIVSCIDGRGTGFKGADFKKVTYKELGKYEVIDQIEVAKQLGNLPYIDANRIGIWGWSYGGFMSSNCLLKGNDVFKMAIAVAPVTSWRFYDSIYTERYMQTPQENASGYDENSPIFHTDKLKGNYLLIHGSGDDNVHVQNTMRMINSLVENNKDFQSFIYPDRTHGIYKGRNTRLHLYTKMTNYIYNNL